MQRRHCTLALAALLATALSRPALARDDDDGEFLILHARYGTEERNVNVTERLRELARQDRRFRLTNDVFGVDPDPGRTKTLRIFTRDRQGHDRSFDYREYDTVDGAQFIGWGGGRWGEGEWSRGWHGGPPRDEGRDSGEFTILYATYGTSRREVDVTDRLRELARRDQRFRLGNEVFGMDPDPGQTKRLRIVARDRGGRERSFEYREYDTVDGAQFVGWGRGDWGRGGDYGPGRPGDRLVIESASYGSDNRWIDATQALRAQARGDRFEAEVSNELVGYDPAPGQRKLLTVSFRLGNGPVNTVRVREGDRLRLP
ncbi:hypothetical protein LXT12_01440 [Pelomonas sp. P7]|uniref:Uncharacterized protein n=1 Tax=Pelomonas caseinilytica TaxID=2906763 RepID=A0ABS8X6A2_9BURK|nr:hypothetical protein [Pelomonas sp. P7]MCE4535922.1 hypothetical protein [Pelomonas sp. P7]